MEDGVRYTNKLNLPQAIVDAAKTERHNKPNCLSATTLLKGVKEIVLLERHWDEIEQDVADNIWAIWGTAVHALLEKEGENEFSEVDVDMPIEDQPGGLKVTGRIDNYNMETGVITDYKTASVWKPMLHDFSDWNAQGYAYAVLLRANGMPATKCRFVMLLKDHSKSKARRDASYPQSPCAVYEFSINDDLLELHKAHMQVTVEAYQAALKLDDDDIPPCRPDERWQDEDKWAVMKKGRKSAVRVLDTEKEAGDLLGLLGAGHYLEKREGIPRKCLDYCACSEFCNFGRAAQEVNNELA